MIHEIGLKCGGRGAQARGRRHGRGVLWRSGGRGLSTKFKPLESIHH